MNRFARTKRLRFAGSLIFLSGLAAAGLISRGRASNLKEGGSTAGFYKSSSRQIGVMYGQFGVMVDEFAADLKRPGVQAIIVLIVGTIGAAGCFYFARLFEKRPNES